MSGLREQPYQKVTVKTFGLFDVILNGRSIRFRGEKSKELLAFLIEKEGAYVPLDTSAGCLWPGSNTDKAKNSHKDAVSKLRLTLFEYGLDDLLLSEYALYAVNRERIACDLWTAAETGDYSGYNGEYMTQYADWSQVRQAALDILKTNRK